MRTVTICDHDELGVCGGDCYRCRLEALQRRLDELVEAVGEMRHAQIDYWRRNRNHAAFLVMKRAEKKVDELLQEIREPRLFSVGLAGAIVIHQPSQAKVAARDDR